MKTRAQIGSFPIHPILVSIPVASFPISLLFDIVYLLTGNPFWYAMAFWVMVVGIAGAVAAAVPGLFDYLTSVPAAAMPTARRHGLANGAVLAWFIIDAIVRVSGPMFGPRVGVAILMSLIGNAALIYTGSLGATLVYRYRLGVEEPAAPKPAEVPAEERRAA